MMVCLPSCNIDYVIFNVTPKLKQLDIKLYEAALDLGLSLIHI